MSSKDRLYLMISKLTEQADQGNVENNWDSEFIASVQRTAKQGQDFSTKQIVVIERLFNKY